MTDLKKIGILTRKKEKRMNSIPTESDSRILIFKCICNFIKDLNDSFGKTQKSLCLYAHLMDKTGIMHEEPIKKHIQIFYEFIKENEESILGRQWGEMKRYDVHYSDKVGFDLRPILQTCDTEEREAILQHLLTLLAVLDPSSAAKEMLRKEMETKKQQGQSGSEESFLRDMIDTVSSQMDASVENPLQLMNKMMNSGIFTNLVEKMNTSLSEGQLDLGKMVNTVQKMMSDFTPST